MKRFLLVWALLGLTAAVASIGVSAALFRRADLRHEAFVRLLLVPVLQAAVVLLVSGASVAAPARAVRRLVSDPAAWVLVAACAAALRPSWGLLPAFTLLATASAGAVFLVLALRWSGRSGDRVAIGLFGAVLLLLAADVHPGWHAALADRLMPASPRLVRSVVVYGALFAGALTVALRASSALEKRDAAACGALEAAVAVAFACALLVLGNGFLRPYLPPPWKGIALALAEVAALFVALAALWAARPDARPSAGRALQAARDGVVAAVVVALAAPLYVLPWQAAGRLGRVYGRLAGFVWREGWRTALVNLRRAYGPDMTRERAAREAAEVFAHLGQSVAEAVQFVRRHAGGRAGWEALYVAEDPQLEARLLADPRPKVFVTGHLGSWEVALMMLACRVGERGGAVARKVDNVVLDAVLRRFRMPHPGQWIDKAGAALEARRRLEAGDSVALLLDENGGHRGVFVRFFGRPASTARTAALLALDTGAPIVVGAALRRGQGPFLYRLALLEPVMGDRGPEAVRELTGRIASVWERWVRDDPLQWRWAHWRWKTRPDGTEETYTAADVRACFADRVSAPLAGEERA